MSGVKGVAVKAAIAVPLVFVGVAIFQSSGLDPATKMRDGNPGRLENTQPLADKTTADPAIQREPAGAAPSAKPATATAPLPNH